jgi:hypothetical protein
VERTEACDGVGLRHDPYVVDEGPCETAYDDAPPTGVGKAGTLQPIERSRRTAAGRLGATDGDGVSDGPRGTGAESVGTE